MASIGIICKRIEIENLELDGNFTNHTPFTTAANPTGYKSAAIDVWARTGRIKNVRIRHFGSVGQVPFSKVEGNAAGIEAFPVHFTTFDDAKGSYPDPVPWLVEEVEVSNFHSVHRGYATLILGSVNTQQADTSARAPVALFRRCGVHGELSTIAFGAAGHNYYVLTNGSEWANPDAYIKTGFYSSLSRHEANVVLNASLVSNTDTGSVHDWRMRHGAYLDVLAVGALGVAQDTQPKHVNYEFNTNLIRLRGRTLLPDYSEYYITNNQVWGTDPNLALGRLITNWSVGLVFQGIAKDVSFNGNRITTWPAAGFQTYTDATNESTFRLIWPLENNTYYNSQFYARSRSPAQNVTLSGNVYSTTAFGFTGATALSNHVNVTSFTSNSAPSYTQLRLALSTPPTGFDPTGRVERVLRKWSGTNLVGVEEVAFGQTYLTNGNQLSIRLRAVEHKTAASGSPGTVALVDSNLWVAVELSPVNGGTKVLGMFHQNTLSSGLANYTVNLGTNTSAWVRLQAWMPPFGGATNFDAHSLPWASHDLSVGTVVQVSAAPDVADDKNLAVVKRAILRFTRTGPTNSALAVSFLLPGSGEADLISPVDYRNLLATHGAASTNDYTFGTVTGGSLSTITQSGTNTVTFSAGSSEVLVPVVPKADNLTEANVIRVKLLPGSTYALGRSTRTDVLVYDGPLWNLVELSPSDQHQTTDSAPFAINHGVTDASGQFTVHPRIVGRWSYYGTPDITNGGVWKWPSIQLDLLANDFFPRGVSFRAGAGDQAWVAGYQGNNARLVKDNGTSWTTLAHWGSGPSAALALSPDGNHVAGYSWISNQNRAVAWFNRGVATDLAGTKGSGVGSAYGINNAGVVVGQASLKFTNSFPNRPFRTKGNAVAITDFGDILPTPGGNGEGAALAVNTNGVVVGWYRIDDSIANVAVLWSARTSGQPNTVGTSLGVWYPPWQGDQATTHKLSRALGVNDPGSIVGWSSPTNAARRAMHKPSAGGFWQDLNDRHFVNYPSGWVLQEAVGINNQRLIIGTGTLNGMPRGFVLIPRTPGP